jgi:rhodanese-related sulfurtransferase
MVQTISPQQLLEQIRSGQPVELIDVRTPAEFREIHVECARNEPLERLDVARLVADHREGSGHPVYVICRSGSRGKQACEKLLNAGHALVINVEGGTLACEAAGLSVVRGKKAISLERQVRIVAGAMVVAGAALGFFVHPYFVGLSAFVGAGLIFAGVTDTCGMALILARMPWNQCGAASTCSPPPSKPVLHKAS